MHITRYVDRDPLSQGYIAAAQQAGVPFTEDYNGPRFEGIAYLQYNTPRGWRRHAAGNYRVLMTLGGELLAYGMVHELAQLDEKCFLEVFQPAGPRPAAKKKVRG